MTFDSDVEAKLWAAATSRRADSHARWLYFQSLIFESSGPLPDDVLAKWQRLLGLPQS